MATRNKLNLRLFAVLSVMTVALISFGIGIASPKSAKAAAQFNAAETGQVFVPNAACARGAFPFADVTSSYWAYDFIKYLWCDNSIDGTSATTFNPGGNATRAHLAKIIVHSGGLTINTAGGPHFSDVPASSPFYQYIETLYNRGAIAGYSDGTFRPNNEVTRSQASKVIVGAYQWPLDSAGNPTFSDVLASNPFYPFVETIARRGIISGYSDGTFRPLNNITRAQISKIAAISAIDETPQAKVRVVHASPGAPAVDVYVDSRLVSSNLAFGNVTGFASLPAGPRNMRVFPSGANPDTTNPVISADLTLAANSYYTVFAKGNVPEIAPLAVADNFTPPAAGQARVRAAHLSPNAPAVDIAVTGGSVIISNLAFGQVSDYIEVPAGSYDLEVRVAGTPNVVLTIPDYQLDPGTIHSVAALGLVGGTPDLSVLPLTNTQLAQAQVRVVHASPDAPAVDVYVDGVQAIENLAFNNATPFTALTAGTHNVKVYATGADPGISSPVINADLNLTANTHYSVFATGVLASIAPLVTVDNLFGPPAGQSRVRVIHASPNAPAVDIAVTGGPVLFSNLAFRDVAEYINVPAGTYDLEVRAAGTSNVVLTIPDYALLAGSVYSIAAVGLAGGTPELTVLPLVNTSTAAANVRVAHTSPDAPGVDVYVDGVLVVQNLAFGTVSGFAGLWPGNRNVKVYATGADPNSSTPVISASLNLDSGSYYTVFATGALASIAPLVAVDDLTSPISGQARIRVAHLSPNAPAIDVAVEGGPVLFSNLSFKQVADYIEVPAAAYDLEVRLAGTSTVVLSIPNYALASGRIYTVAAIGLAGGTPPLSVLPLEDEAQQ